MKSLSIRLRLASWYSLVFAAGILAFSLMAWLGMRASLYRAIDRSLEDRADNLAIFLVDIAALPGDRLQEELQEHVLPGQGGNLFQVRGPDGRWLFRSDALAAGHVPLESPGLVKPHFENRLAYRRPVRLYARPILVQSEPYAIQVAADTTEAIAALHSFRMILLLAAPLLLLAAGAGGYWISGRALAPVDQITRAAQRIGLENISQRLQVPETRDELQRLSETLNQMLARLETSVVRMSRFTADASHELRAPISLIRTTAEIATRRTRTAGEYRQALDEILHEAERTSQVVDNLMLLARADSGRELLHRETADLAETLRAAAEAGEKLAGARAVGFSLNLSAGSLPVYADTQALRRALVILMDNAAKYTQPGGWVRVEAGTRDAFAVVSVSDNGLGISGDDLPHIFDRFWRADQARSRDQGGAGLGLSIAQWIAAGHGGAIEVESKPGRGSIFRLTVPLHSLNGDPA